MCLSKCSVPSKPPSERLPACFGLLCDADELRDQQIRKLKSHQARTLEPQERRVETERHVLLRQYQPAVTMLLETDANQESFYVDSLRACVIAAVQTPANAQNTIKLVAMNLIAAGKLDEGVELLCLVGCNLDACYYLQSEGLWHRAALLAKSTLHYAAYAEVLSRWADNLGAGSSPAEAVLLYLTFGKCEKAAELIERLGWPHVGAVFISACTEEQLIPKQLPGLADFAHSDLDRAWLRAAEWAEKSLGHLQLAKLYRSQRCVRS